MKIFAHRGYSAKYPENTMLAFRKAVEYKADGIETDVHKTKDGVLVLCHDETIDRTSNGSGMIKDMTYEQLAQYDYKYDKEVDEFIPIPKLEELLQLVKESGILLNIEIKTDRIHYENIEKMTYDLVKQYDLLDKVIFSSFYFESLLKLKEIDENAQVGFLYAPQGRTDLDHVFEEGLEKALNSGIKRIHPLFWMLNKENLDRMKEMGVEVNAWTINEAKDIENMKECGLDGCISNFTELAITINNGGNVL